MLMRQVLDVYELLDRADASGEKMEEYLRHLGAEEVEVTTIEGPKGKTDMIRVTIPGTNGKSAGGKAPTLGVFGKVRRTWCKTGTNWLCIRWRWCTGCTGSCGKVTRYEE